MDVCDEDATCNSIVSANTQLTDVAANSSAVNI